MFSTLSRHRSKEMPLKDFAPRKAHGIVRLQTILKRLRAKIILDFVQCVKSRSPDFFST